MPAIILFRFHKEFDVCVQTLKLLRKLNPGLPIHGLYGGSYAVPEHVTDLLDSIWAMPLDDPYYKWKNGDLCVRRWFIEHGYSLPFDHIYLTEWDMLFLKPMMHVFPSLETDVNYASIFGDYNQVKESGWYWLKEQFGYETRELLEHLEQRDMRVDLKKLLFAIMGGAIFCRKFLELYAEHPVPGYSNDEVRFSIYSAAFGITLKSNGIMESVKKGVNLFNAENEELSEKDFTCVLDKNGSILHPIRFIIENLNEKIGV